MIGASGGGMIFTTGEDFSTGSLRPIGQVVFKYNFTQNWSGVLESGFGWNAYPTADPNLDDTLAVVIPTTVGGQYRFQFQESHFWPQVGAGLGLYSLGIKDTFRTWAETAAGERYTWTRPGAYAKLGGEYIFDNAAAINVDLLWHAVLSKDTNRYPDKWGNQNTSFFQFRVGANYYFSLGGGSGAVPADDE